MSNGRRPRLGAALSVVGFGWLGVACGSSDGDSTNAEPICLDKPADATCTTVPYGIHNGQIAPTFSDIFSHTLQQSCGSQTTCHAGSRPQNGLALDVQATAYTDLMAENAAGTTRRVIPRDTKCGELIVRLETPNVSWGMPKGSHLPDDLLCVFRHWIAEGAPR